MEVKLTDKKMEKRQGKADEEKNGLKQKFGWGNNDWKIEKKNQTILEEKERTTKKMISLKMNNNGRYIWNIKLMVENW